MKNSQKINIEKIKIGVSSCLTGERVRWDGDHKQDSYITDVLARYFNFIPICPEVEVGMGVPRETVALYGTLENHRMLSRKTETDWTRKMNRYSKNCVGELKKSGLCGYIFKSKSPSCGMSEVPVYSINGSRILGHGPGMFADIFMKKFPLIPVEDEARLNDPVIRENFIARVFSYHKLMNG